jgi:endonuclease I
MKKLLFITIFMLSGAVGCWAQGPNDSGEYYKAADGKKGAALKTALCGVIYNRDEEGADLNAAYKALWTHFQTTDKQADGSVWDMYSNMRAMTFGDDQDKGSGGNNEGEYYNREHSFPNSWFGGKVMPMYTDLHHVYPTDKLVNNKRANYPFGETKGETYTSKGGFSKLGRCTTSGYTGTVFEPADEYKGDFARTYFYMVTRYEADLASWGANHTLTGSKYPGLKQWQLTMLLRWAQQDPVSPKETARNRAVYNIQRNRNPFIDYPGLEQLIWGDKMSLPFSYDNYEASLSIEGVIVQETQRPSRGIYDLQGRRISTTANQPAHPLKPGLYIRDGKKIYLK